MLRAPLGEILLKLGHIDEAGLEQALADQQRSKLPLGKTVVLLGHCSAEQVTQALAAQSGGAYVDLGREVLDSSLCVKIPATAAYQHGVVPWRIDDKRPDVLLVACKAPIRFQALDAVRRSSKMGRVVPFMASDGAVDAALLQLYGPNPAAQAPEAEAIPEIPVIELTADEATGEPTVPGERPVLLFGWNPRTLLALKSMCESCGVPVRVASASDVRQTNKNDILFSPLPALEAFVSTGLRPAAQWIVAGQNPEREVRMARKLGAKAFIPTPIVSKLLLRAVSRFRGTPVAGEMALAV